MIKRFIKSILHWGCKKEIRDHLVSEMESLKTIPMLPINYERLSSRDEINLISCFNSKQIEDDWQEAYQSIAPLEIPDGTGGVNPGDRRAIFYLVRQLRPSSILEIGTHIGASTVYIASALSISSRNDHKRNHLTTVDILDVNNVETKPWLKYGVRLSPAEDIQALNLSHLVTFVVSSSLDFLRNCNQHFDFIFLDGDHSAATVYQEMPLALEHLTPTGVVLLHDYFPNGRPLWSDGSVIPGPFLAVSRFIEEGAPLSICPLGKLPWPTKLKSNLTSLALLLKV